MRSTSGYKGMRSSCSDCFIVRVIPERLNQLWLSDPAPRLPNRNEGRDGIFSDSIAGIHSPGLGRAAALSPED